MTPDDVTQPITQRPTPQAAHSPYNAPPPATSRRAQPPRAGRGPLWAALGFAIGCLLTTVVAVALLAPAPARSAPAQTTGATLTVTLTDALLTQSLGSNLGAGAVALTQPQVHIQANGQMVVSGTLQGPLAAGSDATVVLQPYVSQNTLAIRALRASVAGIALPTSVVAALLDQVNQQLRQSSSISYGVGQALVVTAVSFADGAMTLSYAPASA